MSNNLIRFDIEGDAILSTSHGSHILVSSKILQHASPLFKVIFSDEDIKSKLSTDCPPVIPVLDLYAPSLHFVCGILHGHDSSIWQPSSSEQLFNVAMTATYELRCQDRINWLIELYLESFLMEPKSSENIIDLLATAMVCRFERIFQELSIMLVYEATAPLSQLFSRNSGKVLGKTLLGNNLLLYKQ